MEIDIYKWSDYAQLLVNQSKHVLSTIYAVNLLISNPPIYSLVDSSFPIYNDTPISPSIQSHPNRKSVKLFKDANLKEYVSHVSLRFPEVGDLNRVNGFKEIKADAKIHYDELESYYQIVIKTVEFLSAIESTLLSTVDLTNIQISLKGSINDLLMQVFIPLNQFN